jgi:hypothetical protein
LINLIWLENTWTFYSQVVEPFKRTSALQLIVLYSYETEFIVRTNFDIYVFIIIQGIFWDRHGRYRSWIYNYLCKLKHHSGEMYSIQHYVMKFISDLRQVGGFSGYSSFFHHDITEILLKLVLNTTPWDF